MSRMRLVYRVSRDICQVVYAGLLRGRVFGVRHVPLDGGVLLVSNHQSFLDPMLVTLALPRECSYMARETLFKGGLATRILKTYNAFEIKRGTADLRGIKEALRRL
ncbi:MAG: 1-acyl-sn-glycerol-3-phosphate acyltransferase, partial [Phycisphaerae bacterium]|nr:1-acyl-sn-glycerol-3-phosphate acyltransferase [Phycisphaerae bacterium]